MDRHHLHGLAGRGAQRSEVDGPMIAALVDPHGGLPVVGLDVGHHVIELPAGLLRSLPGVVEKRPGRPGEPRRIAVEVAQDRPVPPVRGGAVAPPPDETGRVVAARGRGVRGGEHHVRVAVVHGEQRPVDVAELEEAVGAKRGDHAEIPRALRQDVQVAHRSSATLLPAVLHDVADAAPGGDRSRGRSGWHLLQGHHAVQLAEVVYGDPAARGDLHVPYRGVVGVRRVLSIGGAGRHEHQRDRRHHRCHQAPSAMDECVSADVDRPVCSGRPAAAVRHRHGRAVLGVRRAHVSPSVECSRRRRRRPGRRLSNRRGCDGCSTSSKPLLIMLSKVPGCRSPPR